MDSEKIEPTTEPAGGSAADEGDDVAETRSPDAIQKEIEQTRAELAETIDAIADRISPKRAASRGAAAVKAQVSGVFGHTNGNGNGSGPASVLDASPSAAAHTDTQQREQNVRAVAATGGGSAYAGTSEFAVHRTLRTDRILVILGVLSALAALGVLRRAKNS